MCHSQHQPDNLPQTSEGSRQDKIRHRIGGAGGRGFGKLEESIITSLSIGIVAFDKALKIVHVNTEAGKLIGPEKFIDKWLTAGTDSNIWGNWSEVLSSVVSTGNKAEFKAVKYGPDDERKLLDIVCMPLGQDTNEDSVVGAVVIEDVTEKIDIENQLSEYERFAAIGKIAGKIAHELNNPIDGIMRYINLTLRVIEQGDLDKGREYLGQSRNGLMRMVQIISELLEFSRNTYPDFEAVAIDKVLEEAIKTMESRAEGVEIGVTTFCETTMPKVRGSSLFQVFCNLTKNAIEAMGGKGKLDIVINCSSDAGLSIHFRDSGPGFLPEYAEKIFEPFFTTKSHSKGTGLGLAICKDLVEKHGGRIIAENISEGGCVFTVKLPLSSGNLF